MQAGRYERYLFDSIVHSTFKSDSKQHNPPEKLESLVQEEAMTAALLKHLQSISQYHALHHAQPAQ